MAVPRPNIIWRGAHPNNFTVGRPGGGLDGRNTFHHVVGSAESAVVVFNNPNRGASSHFVITDEPGVIFQIVRIEDTAWCDGNWDSNLKTISMEHHGDWRNGYDNPVVRENSAQLVAWLRENYGVNRYVRHRDVSNNVTVCPADLPVEWIWNRSSEIIAQYQAPPPDTRPEWLKNRSEVPGKMVYAQKDAIFVVNLNDGESPLDSRRFPLNQNFEVKGQTKVGNKEFWITKSSFDLTIASGILKSEVADTPYVPPVPQPIPTPPVSTTPDWADALIHNDSDNKQMYVLRATPLIDLENGHPVMKDGKEVWFSAGDIINDISTHTIVNEVTYQVTEYSLQETIKGNWRAANGIRSNDLTVDPKACPPGTPANPTPAPAPADPIEPMPDVPNDPSPTPVPAEPTPPEPTEPTTPEQPAPAKKPGLWLTFLMLALRLLQARVNKKLTKK